MSLTRALWHALYWFMQGVMVHDFIWELGPERAFGHLHGFWVGIITANIVFLAITRGDYIRAISHIIQILGK